jgi:pyruvate/2-oxoglutarate dehydrogenase complex dihydrolipoamide acyltransferase (E2) component
MATLLVVPHVNVNDDSVVFVKWTVAPGAAVSTGQLVCEVETTKAAAEILATADGVLVQSAEPGQRIAVGATIGAIAATREAAAAALAPAADNTPAASGVAATPKARALARQHNIRLDDLRARGVVGTIKESDVRAYMSEAGTAGSRLGDYVESRGAVPAFDAAVAANLRESARALILTTLDMHCGVDAAYLAIDRAKASGRMISLLHVLIAAAGQALRDHPRVRSVVRDGTLYTYKSSDVAFVTRMSDGRLFTPVVRAADQQTVDQIAKTAQGVAFKVMRGTVRPEDVEGAAFTISHVDVPGTARVAALPNVGQAAILGVSAAQYGMRESAGTIAPYRYVTLTLTYDHAVCDGVAAANFLAAIVKSVEAFTG